MKDKKKMGGAGATKTPLIISFAVTRDVNLANPTGVTTNILTPQVVKKGSRRSKRVIDRAAKTCSDAKARAKRTMDSSGPDSGEKFTIPKKPRQSNANTGATPMEVLAKVGKSILASTKWEIVIVN